MLFECVLAGLAALALVVVAALVFRRWGTDDEAPDGATAGFCGGMLSALFLLVFAIAVIVPWTDADSAQDNSSAEAQAVAETAWAVGGLPAPVRAEVRARLSSYLDFVARTEWPALGDHGLLAAGWTRLDQIRTELMAVPAGTADVRDARENALSRVADIYTARRTRGTETGGTLPTIVLVSIVVTGAVVVLFPFLAGARPRRMAVVPLAVMAALLGVSVFLVFDIDNVFAGPLKVGPGAYQDALAEIARISS